MSSTNSPIKTRYEPKVLLRSTSFQKLCSIPYNFKIEAIQSYKEHIKTVINLLKAATRSYVISVYFKVISIFLFHYYTLAQWSLLNISHLASTRLNSPEANVAKSKTAKAVTEQLKRSGVQKPNTKHGKSVTLDRLLDNPTVGFQTILTYSCIAYVAFQTVWLANALTCSANIPLGLVFLMLDLGYMGSIILKIALNGTK